mmetsp:Transcript_159950/g.298412  ORF Transcript_159950/g.298412 Transcript_159950/m.298412 type:complete len:329 (-) Transcript_159950:59-1045(-)
MDLPNLERLSVKELRKHAAIRNVPLTSIAAAVEKRDLINLILCAAPVLDQYDINGAPKVWNAESLAAARGRPKDKKKKKKHRSSSSSSSSSGGRKKKKKKKRRKRSPSITIITPPMKGLPSSLSAPVGVPSAAAVKGAAAATAFMQLIDKPAPIVVPSAVSSAPKPLTYISEADKAAAKAKEASLAQKGMAAAAALGYDVLPKAAQSSLPAAPMEGLRPSVNPPGTGVPMGQYGLPNLKRVCTNYLISARCDLGANCPDAHILDPEEEMHIRAKFKQQECHFGASCTRAGCLFLHPGEKKEECNFIPAGSGVTMRVDNKTGELALDFV